MPAWVKFSDLWSYFQIWGETIFGDFMLSNDTEQTNEDILSVRTGYVSKTFRFIENIVSLFFFVQNIKKIQIWG